MITGDISSSPELRPESCDDRYRIKKIPQSIIFVHHYEPSVQELHKLLPVCLSVCLSACPFVPCLSVIEWSREASKMIVAMQMGPSMSYNFMMLKVLFFFS